MPQTKTPLRYPGGKSSLWKYFSEVLVLNGLEDCTYIEPFAGGAGAALALLCAGKVKKLKLNDADPCIYAFWQAALNETDRFIKQLQSEVLTIDSWEKHRYIYQNWKSYSTFEVGYSTFFLNRCNRSGIIVKAGPIGGRKQDGEYTLGVRFIKAGLVKKLLELGKLKDKIEIYGLDALDFLKSEIDSRQSFTYLDPPYYRQGSKLYLNYYQEEDHIALAKAVESFETKWIITYDNESRIKELYGKYKVEDIALTYSANNKRRGNEILIYDEKRLSLPKRVA